MMNDTHIASALREVAADVPERSDDEAADALRAAVVTDLRRRNRLRVVAAAVALAVVGVAGVLILPSRGDVGVATDPGPPSELSVTVESDLSGYTGVHPPVVIVSEDRMGLELVDSFDLLSDSDTSSAYAVVEATLPIADASASPTSVFLEFAVEGALPFVVEVDLATGETLERRDGTSDLSPAGGTDRRIAYLRYDESGSAAVVVEDRSSTLVVDDGVSSEQPPSSLRWSDEGLLAVGYGDGSVVVLDPSRSPDFVLAEVDGPLHGVDWAGPMTLIGTAECCAVSQVLRVGIETGVVTESGVEASQVASVAGGGSPWGVLYLDDDGALRGTEGPREALREIASIVRW